MFFWAKIRGFLLNAPASHYFTKGTSLGGRKEEEEGKCFSPSWSSRFIGLRMKSVTFEDSLFEECYFEDVTSSNTFFRNCTFINTVFYNTGKWGAPGGCQTKRLGALEEGSLAQGFFFFFFKQFNVVVIMHFWQKSFKTGSLGKIKTKDIWRGKGWKLLHQSISLTVILKLYAHEMLELLDWVSHL